MVFIQNIVQRVVAELLCREDPTLRNLMFCIAFGCHVLYKVIILSYFFLNGRICLCLKGK